MLTGPGPDQNPAQPLTVVVSEVPPPGEGTPEATALLDRAGTDRAVVLGPPVASDGTGPPVRAAVELTRMGPGGPVQVRPLTGPPSTTTPDGTTGTANIPNTMSTSDTMFHGADVLLPLADALGTDLAPDPAPATPHTVRTESGDPFGTGPDRPAGTENSGTGPSAPSRPEAESVTDLHLESGHGHGHGSGVGAGGRAPGDGGTPPPPPAVPDHPAVSPDVVPPAPGRIVVRPVERAGATSDDRGPEGEPVVTTLDGHTVPVAQLRRWISDAVTVPQPGRAVQTLTISQSPAEDGTAHAAGRRELLGQNTFRGVRTTTPAPEAPQTAPQTAPPAAPETVQDTPTARTVFTGPPTPLPGSDTTRGADYFAGHGTPRTVTLGTDDAARPTAVFSGVQLGEVLKSWARDGDQDRPLVLFSCETGRQPLVAGLPVAQHVANRTGRQVYAPTTEAGTGRDSDGIVRAVLTEGPDGPGRWRLFTPEPSGADLDRVARDAGLHTGPGPADPFARARTLQQIRTLRDVLGPDAEQRPENRDLLAGLAYVDGLRWHSPDTATRYGDGRMTPDLLRRMVGDRSGVTPPTGPVTEPSVAEYTEFLRAAAELRATGGPDTTLDALLPPPPPALPPTALISQEDVRGLAYAPSARVTWSLSSTPLKLSDLALSPADTAELASRRPDLAPAPAARPESLTLSSSPAATTDTVTVHADGRAWTRLTTPGDGNCFFQAVLDSARGQNVRPAWAERNVDGLRALLRDRITGSELATAAAEATPDPVLAVVDDLRMTALAGVRDPDGQRDITRNWNRIAQEVVTDGDAARWRRILKDSGYPQLAEVAPTPADARRLGTEGLLAAAAEHSGLWSSPFADLLPQALAHTLDLDLRLVQPDSHAPGSTYVTALHPGAGTGTLHLAYNGVDHYDALIPTPTPEPTTPAPIPSDSTPTTPTPAPIPVVSDPAVPTPDLAPVVPVSGPSPVVSDPVVPTSEPAPVVSAPGPAPVVSDSAAATLDPIPVVPAPAPVAAVSDPAAPTPAPAAANSDAATPAPDPTPAVPASAPTPVVSDPVVPTPDPASVVPTPDPAPVVPASAPTPVVT
ncbi:hypothetical protein AB0J02_03015, partial [Streptomyces sp. NPDC050264]